MHKTYTIVTEEAHGRGKGPLKAGSTIKQTVVEQHELLSPSTPLPVETSQRQSNGTPTLTLSNELSSTIDFPSCLLPDPEAGPDVPAPELYQYWNLSQWWPKCEGVPVRFSRVFFYFTNTLETPWTDDLPKWHVVQHYTTEDRPCVSDTNDVPGNDVDIGGDSRPNSFYFTMKDPVLIPFDEHGFPLMGVSFNHIGWVDQVSDHQAGTSSESASAGAPISLPGPSTRSQSRLSRILSTARRHTRSSSSSAPVTDESEPEQVPKKRRVFRLVAFPPPGALASEHAREARGERMLDIPEEILDEALHVFLEPALGAVLILTSRNEMHRFDYA